MPSRRTLLLAGSAVVACLALLAGLGLAAVCALRQEPAFYAHSLAAKPASQKEASDALLRQVSAVTSAAQQSGSWQAAFTAEQINGWLAFDIGRNHPGLLPQGFRDPRVAIAGDRATIACRYDDGRLASVVSLDVRLYLTQPGEVGLEVVRARAGWLPLPLGKILEEVTSAAAAGGWRIRWLQSEGQPVAAVQVIAPGKDSSELILEELAIRDGALWVAGTSRRAKAAPTIAAQPGEKASVQR